MDYIMEVVAMGHAAMSLMAHALTLACEKAAFHPLSVGDINQVHDDKPSNHRNWELAIVHHYLFLRCYNMDPR
jgi:hypothetical protein